MSEQTNQGQDQDERREQLRKQLKEKFGDVESIGIEPLIDEALDDVSGGACSWMWCSSANAE